MERRSSRMVLWVLAVVVGVIVVAGGVLTIWTVSITSDARAQRCEDVVAERNGDRLLWIAIFQAFENDRNTEAFTVLRRFVDEYKPPLSCDDHNIPVVIEEP